MGNGASRGFDRDDRTVGSRGSDTESDSYVREQQKQSLLRSRLLDDILRQNTILMARVSEAQEQQRRQAEIDAANKRKADEDALAAERAAAERAAAERAAAERAAQRAAAAAAQPSKAPTDTDLLLRMMTMQATIAKADASYRSDLARRRAELASDDLVRTLGDLRERTVRLIATHNQLIASAEAAGDHAALASLVPDRAQAQTLAARLDASPLAPYFPPNGLPLPRVKAAVPIGSAAGTSGATLPVPPMTGIPTTPPPAAAPS
eukprot:TRINITY_DN57017_c0_g1_i1.p1 TRINITY_DN57017_c0_g1~~TRINITY_DN57017_c0_g1_i1.p1  ORF type:complete len:264 (+),score=41.99 TRINITY_DN57017_c0_g1_i1:148-939(+)